MHDINWTMKNFHIKTNLIHTLHCMQKVGTLHVEEFKDVLLQDELATTSKLVELMKENKTSYNIQREKFLEFVLSLSNQSILLNL